MTRPLTLLMRRTLRRLASEIDDGVDHGTVGSSGWMWCGDGGYHSGDLNALQARGLIERRDQDRWQVRLTDEGRETARKLGDGR